MEPVERSVTLCLRSSLLILNGNWNWEMESAAVYCSDVMHFPADFVGTKGIVHPDDLQKLSSALQLMADGALAHLDFRLITTWGEVKALQGTRVTLEKAESTGLSEKESWEGPLEQLAMHREAEVLKQRADLADAAEKLHRIGCWAVNKSTGETWYSDGMYRLHHLPPQSLNAHANTFNLFLHTDDRTTVIEALEKAYVNEVPVHLDYRIELPGGDIRTVVLVTYWSYNKIGQPLFSGVLRDQTEEHELMDKAETAVQTARLHQQVMKFSEQHWNTGYWFVNLVTRKTTYSDNYYRIYGLKQQALPSYNAFLNLVHPDDRVRVHDLINRMYTEHQLPEAEFRIIRPEGKMRYLKQSGKVFINGGDLIMIGTVHDVTVQKGLEKKIAELSEKTVLHDLIQSVNEKQTDTGFITWYPEGNVLWSEGFYRLLGYKPDSIEPLPRLLHRQIHPDDLKTFKDAEALVTNGQVHEGLRFRILNRGGARQLSINFHSIESGSRQIVVGIVQDFTKEEILHQKLAETTKFGETLNAAISDIVLLTDNENTVLSWNRAAAEKTGIRPEDALYSNLFDLFPALNEEDYVKQLRAAMLGREVRELKVRNLYLHKAHNYYLVPLLNESGEATKVMHVVQDVSRELDLQLQLSERLAFIESLVESSVDRIVVLDKQMNYLYWNKRAEEYYAISKSRVIGRNILEIFPGLRNDPSYNEFRKVLRGETVYLPPSLTNESTEYFETYLIPVKDEKKEVSAILWIVHDLSNELRLQQVQRQAQQQLEEEHRRLNEAQAIGRVGSFEWNAALDEIFWSDEMYRIHGLEPQSENLTIEKVLAFIHPDDVAAFVETVTNIRTQPGAASMAHRIIRADGEVRTLTRNLQSFADETGAVTHTSGTVQDITELQKAEEEKRSRQELLQAAMDSSLDMVNMFKAVRNEEGEIIDFTYIFLNHEAEKWMPSALGKSLLLVQPGVVEEGIFEAFKQVVETGVAQQYEKHYAHEQFDGWFHQSVVKLNDGVATTTANITDRKEAENTLRKNMAVLQNAEALTQMGSWEYDIYTGAFQWSEGMYRLFGLQQTIAVRPEIYLDFSLEEDRPVAKRIVRNIKKTVQEFEEVLSIRRQDGVRKIKIKASVVYNQNGAPEKIAGVDLDITDIKEAEEKLVQSQYWLEQTTKASPDSIVVYDLRQRQPVYLNDCLAKWTGVPANELVNMGVEGRLKLLHPDDRLRLLHFNEMVAAAKDGEVLTIEYRVEARDKSIRWIRNRSKVFQRDKFGKATHLLSILQDTTGEKAAEQKLKELNASLETKNKDLESKNEEITSFAFVASHDLKEPLRKIHTFSDWILTKEENLSETGRENLSRLISSVKRLDTLVEDILALTKVHANDEDLATVDLNAVLHRATQEMKIEIEKAGAVISADELPVVKGVENHLVYLFKNLLSNSIKFQPPGNNPVIKITVEKDPSQLKVSFADNGIGFAPEYRKKIFQMFRRLHARTEFDGTGMGLAICKRIMERHGGSIKAESTQGKGAVFTCCFPVY